MPRWTVRHILRIKLDKTSSSSLLRPQRTRDAAIPSLCFDYVQVQHSGNHYRIWSWISGQKPAFYTSFINQLYLHQSSMLVLKKAIGSPLAEQSWCRTCSQVKTRSRWFCQTTGFPVPTLCVLNVTNLPAAGQFVLIAYSLESLKSDDLWFEGSSPSAPLLSHLYTDSVWKLLPDDLYNYTGAIPCLCLCQLQGQCNSPAFGCSSHMKQDEMNGNLNVLGHPVQTCIL